ncbi:RluA family pseudouridine synthase [Helicobacter muridarum]|uniref:RNA pseudouridylate synthase n=1 Tax=Helicobacter muridarum TaxID=216 RepID=A0A099U0B8_9HELI|nr:RluA family pseudouridine synthase [Helicobacter muridarum]TLE00877.1 RluA family pseudouridine synthase [Helicobacter muridarum]STQ86649.1 ribosomal pseudouridine synthase [Helicobacter muridarum]
MNILYCFGLLQDFARLDIALHEVLGISRHQSSQWIDAGYVFVNDILAKKSRKLFKKDVINIYASRDFIKKTLEYSKSNIYLESSIKSSNAEYIKNIYIEVIAETSDYIILNKPRNLAVHPAPSIKDITLSDYLQFHKYSLSTINGEERSGIVHRLDKDTSGAILIAKNNESHKFFADMLQRRKLGRIYICIISPPLQESHIIVECFMGRNPNNRLKMAKLDKNRFPKARDSKSEFLSIAKSDNGKYELVSVRLFSGRTHQIRVHLCSLNRYIYGDSLYSPNSLSKEYKTKMLLHAVFLYFQGKVFSAKIPKDLLEFLEQNFSNYQEKLQTTLGIWQQTLIDNNDKC